MRPRLEACYFGSGPSGQWDRLADVLRFTAERHCVAWDVRVQRIAPAPRVSAIGQRPNVANTQKLERWCELVDGAADGAPLLLIDVDTAILRPLNDVWMSDFDIAYTTKRGARFPFNGGVLFVRASAAVRAFFAEWWAENLAMLEDGDRHRPYRKRYGGLNQSAFGALIERGDSTPLQLLDLPCVEWNCEDASWRVFDATRTRILHIKTALQGGDLRKAIFAGWKVPAHIEQLASIWRELEIQALAAHRRTA